MEGLYGATSANRRGIAQSGSAPALGAGCREFESLYPDQLSSHIWSVGKPGISFLTVVAVAHQVEHRIVAPEVGGSRPLGHPIFSVRPTDSCSDLMPPDRSDLGERPVFKAQDDLVILGQVEHVVT